MILFIPKKQEKQEGKQGSQKQALQLLLDEEAFRLDNFVNNFINVYHCLPKGVDI